jgi:hypothetical protein
VEVGLAALNVILEVVPEGHEVLRRLRAVGLRQVLLEKNCREGGEENARHVSMLSFQQGALASIPMDTNIREEPLATHSLHTKGNEHHVVTASRNVLELKRWLLK